MGRFTVTYLDGTETTVDGPEEFHAADGVLTIGSVFWSPLVNVRHWAYQPTPKPEPTPDETPEGDADADS